MLKFKIRTSKETYLFQHNLLRKLFCQIWKLAEEGVFLNTIFQTKNFHEMYCVYQLILKILCTCITDKLKINSWKGLQRLISGSGLKQMITTKSSKRKKKQNVVQIVEVDFIFACFHQIMKQKNSLLSPKYEKPKINLQQNVLTIQSSII